MMVGAAMCRGVRRVAVVLFVAIMFAGGSDVRQARAQGEAAALLEAGQAAAGEAVFKKCKACHEVGPQAKNKVGPQLTGVVGRPAGAVDGFDYSNGITGAAEAGLVWNPEAIFAYIADPRGFLREASGNPRAKAKMTFKLTDANDRANVIAYLASFSEALDGVAEPGRSGDGAASTQ